VIDIVGHGDNALVLQEANKAPDLAGERRPVGLMAGKTPTAAPMLLEAADNSVINNRYRNALLIDPEQEMASSCFVKCR
jgi:hypothetical protein